MPQLEGGKKATCEESDGDYDGEEVAWIKPRQISSLPALALWPVSSALGLHTQTGPNGEEDKNSSNYGMLL